MAKAQRHADMSTPRFDIGIHVDIPTLSILLDIETRHGEEEEQIFIASKWTIWAVEPQPPTWRRKG